MKWNPLGSFVKTILPIATLAGVFGLSHLRSNLHAQTGSAEHAGSVEKTHGQSLKVSVDRLPPAQLCQPDDSPLLIEVFRLVSWPPISKWMNRHGVPHIFEAYEGNHGNRVKERFETKVCLSFQRILSLRPSELTPDRVG